MAGSNDFTGQNIQDTYQRVLQLSSSNQIADGTGSALPIKIEGDNVRVTGDIIANQYVVSSSVTSITTQQLSGSTQFGDSSDDTHTFTGNITASGDISGSKTSDLTMGGLLSVGSISASKGVGTGGALGAIGLDGAVIADNFQLHGKSSGLKFINGVNQSVERIYWDGERINISVDDSDILQVKTNGITVEGKVDASGNIFGTDISASGDLFAGDDIFISQTGKIKNVTNTTTNIQFNAGQLLFHTGNEQLRLGGGGAVFNESGVQAFDFRVEGNTDTHLLFVDAGANKVAIGTPSASSALLTVAGAISASGNIRGNNLVIRDSSKIGTVNGINNADTYIQLVDNDNKIILSADGDETLQIQSGVVGIGGAPHTTNPLTVYGNISASGDIFGDDITAIGSGSFQNVSIRSGEGNRRGGTLDVLSGTQVTTTAKFTNAYGSTNTDTFAGYFQGGGAFGTPGGAQKSYGVYTLAGDTNAANPDSIALYAQSHQDGSPNSYAAIFSGSGGIVGINTLEPNEALHVVGNVNVEGAVTASGGISASGDIYAAGIELPDDADIVWAGDINHRIQTSGNPNDLQLIADRSLRLEPDADVLIYEGGTLYAQFDGSARKFSIDGDISCSLAGAQVIATTGSFNHIITDGDTIEFRSKTTKAKLGSMKFDPTDGLKVLDDAGASGLFEAKEVKAANVLESNGTLSVTQGSTLSGTLSVTQGSTFNGTTLFKGTSNTFHTPITSSSHISASGLLKMGTPGALQVHEFYGKVRVLGSDVTIGDGHITASGNISASGNVNAGNAGTGSFDHIITTDNTIEFRDAGTKAPVGFLKMTATGIEELDNNRTALNRIADKVKIQSASNNGGVQYPVMVDSINATPTAEQLKTPTFIQINNAKRAFIVQGKIAALGSSLTIESGSISASGNFFTAGAVTASGDISSSGNISAGNQGTGSFDHIITTNNTIEFRNSADRDQVLGFAKFDAEEGLTVHSASYADTNNRRGAPANFESMPKVSNLLRHTNRSSATIGGVPFADSLDNLTINLPGVNRPGNQNTSGTAATATSASYATTSSMTTGNATTATSASYAATGSVLSTARKIGGVSFDGSADITPLTFNGSSTERFVTPTEFHLSGSSFSNGVALVQYDSTTRGLKANSAARDYKVAAQVCLPPGSSLTGAYYLCTSAKAQMSVTLLETLRGLKLPVQFQSGLNTVTEIPAHVMNGQLVQVHLTTRQVNHKGAPIELMVTIPRGQTFQGAVLRFTV